jgi:hypothetical protein
MIHQINRLTGRTGITQLTHSLVQNIIPPKRYEDRVRSITAKRAFDINPMPSERYKDINLTIDKYHTRSITSANHSKEGIPRNGGIGGLIP